MMRVTTLAILVSLGAGAALAQQAPTPSIQNGKVETRAGASIDREIAAVTGPDPVWVAWREPMIDGKRDSCSRYSDFDHPLSVRGDLLDNNGNDWHAPAITAPTGPVSLEAGTGVVIFARVVDKRVDRLRVLSDDCPVDANGRTVLWIASVPIAESLRTLEALAHADHASLTRGAAQNLMNDATAAIALHRDGAADAILDRLATSDPDSEIRKRAGSLLGTHRGAHGFATLRTLIASEHVRDVRETFVRAIAQTREPQTAEVLLGLLRDDFDATVRSDAAYYLPQRGGEKVVPELLSLIQKDRDDTVRRRGLSGVYQMPGDIGIPTLLQVARTSDNPVMKKQAVTELSHSKDPRALEYLEQLIKR